MKRFRLLPSILMLVMCLGALAVGIYAVSPSQNNVTGTITVIASNPEISITAYYESAIEGNEIGESQTTRTGVEIDITDTRMTFDTANANTASDVDSKYVVIKLQNNSSVEMGVYFAMSETATSTATTPALNLSGETLAGTPVSEIMEVSFSPYAKLPANGSVTMQLSFKLLNLYDENYTIDLSDYTIYLNTETPVNTEYLQTFSITEGLTNNEEKNEVALGTSDLITSRFTLEASSALDGLYAGAKECEISILNRVYEVVEFNEFTQGCAVGLFSQNAFDALYEFCNGDYGQMLLFGSIYSGSQYIEELGGDIGGFYATNFDVATYIGSNLERINVFSTIEIPLEYLLDDNNSVEFYIVVATFGVTLLDFSMSTDLIGSFNEMDFVLSDDNNSYIMNNYKTYYGIPKGSVIEIPAEYKGLPVIGLGATAFAYCSNLKAIIMPETIQSLGMYCFASCINLETVELSSNITTLNGHCFSNCKSLKNIDFTKFCSLEIVGLCEFENCSSITNVDLSKIDKLEILNESFFYGWTGIKELDFSNCDRLIYFAGNTFAECTNLEKIVLPENLYQIDWDAFANCYSLKEIVLPDSLIRIDPTKIFDGCNSLSIKYEGTSTQFKAIDNYEYILKTHSVYCMDDGVTIQKI